MITQTHPQDWNNALYQFNADVSGRTIREILGHTSWRMQEHYSRIADDTPRREYEEKYEVRFNLKGEAVRLQRDSDLSGVEWLAEKIGRRLHSVAGGWCGRHIARPCPKTAADGCYACEDFQTNRQFLPVHQDTPVRARELQSTAEAAGRTRAAEANARIATTIEHLITRITDEEHDDLAPRAHQRSTKPAKPRPKARPMPADNSTHLIEAARRRRLDCIARVHAVLDDLEHHGGPISIAGVASRAGVSRTFLYDDGQAPLLERLRSLAAKQPSSGRPALPDGQRASTKSHETIVRALRAANRKLTEDNTRLRDELAVALGQLRDLRRGTRSTSGSASVADSVSHT
jgi:beta-phosphoglucomutase-like phosphatase (HAD superfamily)